MCSLSPVSTGFCMHTYDAAKYLQDFSPCIQKGNSCSKIILSFDLVEKPIFSFLSREFSLACRTQRAGWGRGVHIPRDTQNPLYEKQSRHIFTKKALMLLFIAPPEVWFFSIVDAWWITSVVRLEQRLQSMRIFYLWWLRLASKWCLFCYQDLSLQSLSMVMSSR